MKPDISPNDLIKQSVVVRKGILGLSIGKFSSYRNAEKEFDQLTNYLSTISLDGFPLIVIGDDPEFLAKDLNNFLWATFTRSNPSHDIYGVHSFVAHKHWGCKGSLIIDARKKPHHAPELVPDPNMVKTVTESLKKLNLY